MATTRKRNVEIDVVVDDRTASAKLKSLGSDAGKAGGGFSSLAGHAKLLAGGFAAVAGTQIVEFLADATQAAIEDEASQRQLALALKNTVGASDAQVASTEQFIEKTMMATGVADDQLRPALAELVRTTGDLETAQSVLGVAMDIAAAKGIPLETVTKAIGKAALGNVGALGRLGVATKDAKGETMDFNEVLNEANRTMGGATAEAMDTMEGKLRRQQTMWAELKEEIGRITLEEFFRQADVLADVLGMEVTPEIVNLSRGMDRARHPIEKITTAVDTQARSYEDLAEGIKDVADEQRASLDPAFNVLKTQRDLSKAQQAYNEAVAEHGPKSMEAVAAMRDLIAADIDAKAAADTMRAQGLEPATDALHDAAVEAKVLTDTIDAAAQAMRNAGKVKAPPWYGREVRDDAIHGARASGGPVNAGGTYLVGEKGPELLHMGSQGGMITPNNAIGGGGGSTYSITVNAGIGSNPADIGQKVVDAIRAYEKRNGRGWRT